MHNIIYYWTRCLHQQFSALLAMAQRFSVLVGSYDMLVWKNVFYYERGKM